MILNKRRYSTPNNPKRTRTLPGGPYLFHSLRYLIQSVSPLTYTYPQHVNSSKGEPPFLFPFPPTTPFFSKEGRKEGRKVPGGAEWVGWLVGSRRLECGLYVALPS